MHDWRTKLALGITAMWAVSYILSVVTSNYVGVGIITPVMVIAASYLLGVAVVRRNGNGNGRNGG